MQEKKKPSAPEGATNNSSEKKTTKTDNSSKVGTDTNRTTPTLESEKCEAGPARTEAAPPPPTPTPPTSTTPTSSTSTATQKEIAVPSSTATPDSKNTPNSTDTTKTTDTTNSTALLKGGKQKKRPLLPTPAVAGSSRDLPDWPPLPKNLQELLPPAKKQDTTKPPEPARKTAWRPPQEDIFQEQDPELHRSNWTNKYKDLVEGNNIKSLPQATEDLEPRILSYITTEATSRKLIGLGREKILDILLGNNIPAKHINRRSYATWDVLLPSEAEAMRCSTRNIIYKGCKLQPEYKGERRTRVTLFNVPAMISTEYLMAILSNYGDVVAMGVTSERGVRVGEFAFLMALKREGFDGIPDTLTFRSWRMTVVVEGRRPHCFSCRQKGHVARDCPQRARITPTARPTPKPAAEAPERTNPAPEAGGGWTEVTGKRKKIPLISDTSDSPAESEQETTVPKGPSPKASPQKPSREQSPSRLAPSATQVVIPLDLMETSFMGLKRRLETEGEKADRKIAVSRKKKKAQTPDPDMNTVVEPTNTHTHIEEIIKEMTPPTPLSQPCDTNTPDPKNPPPQPQTQPEDEPSSEPQTQPEEPTTEPRTLPEEKEPRMLPEEATPSSTPEKKKNPNHPRGRKRELFPENICRVEPEQVDKYLGPNQKRAWAPLWKLDSVDGKAINNPLNFRDAPLVTTFIREPKSRAVGVWRTITSAESAFPGVVLVQREHPKLTTLKQNCRGRVPIFLHPSLYRALKVKYPHDVGGIARTDTVTKELGIDSLGQTVGILTREDFLPVLDTE